MNKAGEGDGIPPELFQILKDDAVKVLDSIKDRNGMDLTEAEGIKKKWQEYTEELYRKDINTQITRMV